MSEKPVKLTKAMTRALRFAVRKGPVTRSMMDRSGSRFASFEALYARGLLDRDALFSGEYRATDAGRAHPATTQGEAP